MASSVPSQTASPPSSSATTSAPSQDPIAKTVVVPRCSSWFDMDTINPIEKRMLPEFFVNEALYRDFPPGARKNSSKTPELYMKYRNYMIHAYRQQPHVYLTATACRRNLAGDACAIMRVHEFLTHWGLINYNVPPHAMPPARHPNYALKPVSSSSESNGNSLMNDPIAVLVHDKTTSQDGMQDSGNKVKCEMCGVRDVEFELTPEAKRRGVASAGSGGNINANANGSTGNIGSGSNGFAMELAPVGGFCLRPGSGLCDECFLQRSFPEGVDATDFTRVVVSSPWTEEETTRLLEAISNNNGNKVTPGGPGSESCDWNSIAAKVQTKTAEECLLHFLELPIMNQMNDVSRSTTNNSILQRPFTYAEGMNAPVLNMSALMAQVDPFVAKAAAQAAIHAIKQLHTIPAVINESSASSTVKTEPVPQGTDQSNDNNGDDGSGVSATSFEEAANAVASSARNAGIATIVKEEIGSDGDVMMKSADSSNGSTATPSTSTASDKPVSVSKEMVAVANEASNATAVALIASRAQALADATAAGPVRGLVTQLLEVKMQQMELKMKQLCLLENTIIAEREQVAKEKYKLYTDRLVFAQEKLGSHGGAENL